MATAERALAYVSCTRGEVSATTVATERKIGNDHLLVVVDAEAGTECGEAYYSPNAMRRLEQVQADFVRKAMPPGRRNGRPLDVAVLASALRGKRLPTPKASTTILARLVIIGVGGIIRG